MVARYPVCTAIADTLLVTDVIRKFALDFQKLPCYLLGALGEIYRTPKSKLDETEKTILMVMVIIADLYKENNPAKVAQDPEQADQKVKHS